MEQENNPWQKGTPSEANMYNWKEEPKLIPAVEKGGDKQLNMVDLFCGCGGFSTGFHMVGFNSILANDIHPIALKTFQHNHPWTDVIVGDIRKVSDEMFLNTIHGREVDVLTAGIPCQGFSRSNRKRYDGDERNFLFLEMIRTVNLLKPKVVLVENVSGLKSAGGGSFKNEITEALEEEGYDVQFTMLNAADYGVPQRRQRVFFLGVRKDLGINVSFPEPTHGPRAKQPHITVWEAIGDLPIVEPGERAATYSQQPQTAYQESMRQGAKILYNHVAPKHPQETIDRIDATKPGAPMYPKFKQRIRLHPNQTSPTQVCGGIRPQFQFGHPTIARGETVRERCRIQSFPDRYQILGGTVQERYQTGNAVPPFLARAIASEIKKALIGEGNDSGAKKKAVHRGPGQLALFS